MIFSSTSTLIFLLNSPKITEFLFPFLLQFVKLLSKFLISLLFTGDRHGIRQFRTGWADGPAYITQCPIQPGESYVYNFTISEQRGTLLWHAHILWLRATIHGAIIILPKHDGLPYPFPKPHNEEVLLLGKFTIQIPNFGQLCKIKSN